ncbi:MAG: phosphatidate cytidylyltransferase [Alphaproteobacteria bacterium]|nr:phosphatidate cytidylyltransferase [Alphaproteobacteria bacterium]
MEFVKFSSIQKRVFSAFVMIPVVLFAIYSGGWLFTGLLIVCAFITLYELVRLSLRVRRSYFYIVLGLIYILLAMLSCYQIRIEYGVSLSFLFVFMVWISDSGAYFVGKTFGGSKLAKTISPNKTWSGYAGALFFPAVFVCVYLLFLNGFGDFSFYFLMRAFILGVLIGISGQAGDLLVSWFKRFVNVKDTGDIIPGHGGILDRIDSMMLCAPVFLFAIGFLVGDQ